MTFGSTLMLKSLTENDFWLHINVEKFDGEWLWKVTSKDVQNEVKIAVRVILHPLCCPCVPGKTTFTCLSQSHIISSGMQEKMSRHMTKPTKWLRPAKTDQPGHLIRLSGYPGWSEFAGRTCHFVGFVTKQLNILRSKLAYCFLQIIWDLAI